MLGYPEDDRSAEQQAKAAATILGDVEYVAARVVARLTGEQVTLQDDNSADGMADIRIDYQDGQVGYVEVTTDIDRGYAEMTSTLRAKGEGLPRELAVPELDRSGSWASPAASSTTGSTVSFRPYLVNSKGWGNTHSVQPSSAWCPSQAL